MKKFFRSKLFICVLMLIVAGVLAFGLLPQLYGSQSQTTTVVCLTEDVTSGQKITSDIVTTKSIGKYGISDGYVTDTTAIVGNYATRDISKREILYKDMFTDNFAEVDGAMDLTLGEGQHRIAVTLPSGAASVGGEIVPGSVVDVLTQDLAKAGMTDEYGNPVSDKVTMQKTDLLSGLTVYKVLNANLENVTELHRQYELVLDSGTDTSDNNTTSNMVPIYVVLIVNDKQAVALANQEFNGNHIQLVLHPDSENVAATASKDDASSDASKQTATAATTETPTAAADTTITMAEYSKITAGMTYQQVVAIVGCEGTAGAPVTSNGVTATVYTWVGTTNGATARVAFVNGVVTDMTQTNLT